MAISLWGITTPDGTDPVLFVAQSAAMAADIDDALATLQDQSRPVRRAEGGDLNLTQSYQNHGTSTTFTPPAGWATYTILAVAVANVKLLTTGDSVAVLIQRTTAGAGANGPIATDNGGADRVVVASETWTGLAGPHDFAFRVRNATAARGVVSTSTMLLFPTLET